jgi:hypothetical protein
MSARFRECSTGLFHLAVAWVLAGPAPGRADEQGPRAWLDAKEIRAELRAAQRRIESIRVIYRSYDYDPRDFPKGTCTGS